MEARNPSGGLHTDQATNFEYCKPARCDKYTCTLRGRCGPAEPPREPKQQQKKAYHPEVPARFSLFFLLGEHIKTETESHKRRKKMYAFYSRKGAGAGVGFWDRSLIFS